MGMIDRLRTAVRTPQETRDFWPMLNFGGNAYPLNFGGNDYPLTLQQTLIGNEEKPDPGYGGFVAWAYRSNAIVHALMARRASLFTEARFQFRQLRGGVPGDLFGNADLSILENPWPNATTSDLLAHMIQDVDLAGNSFTARVGSPARLMHLRPDWVTIVSSGENPWVVSSRVVAFVYMPGGPGSGIAPIYFLREQVAHFAPTPDPLMPSRGMSWLTPIIREISSDIAMTEHKSAFMRNGATPNMVVTFDPSVRGEVFDKAVDAIRKGHEGARNAYKTLFLTGGAKVEKVGSNFTEIDFKVTQGAGETRMSAAAGVPAPVALISEGLQGSSLNAGNFSASMRMFADLTIRPLWRNACASLEVVCPAPGAAELWYDDRHIPALKDDVVSTAAVQAQNSQAVRSLIDTGFEADAVIDAITANDLGRLKGHHTGLFSVQLQAPGSTKMPQGEAPGEVPVGDGTGPEKPAVMPTAAGV
ncbi:MAG TPA: phage portal protein, partial [Solirubrobacteraceae bacterium]